jgi:flavin-dependent dehydrogenase
MELIVYGTGPAGVASAITAASFGISTTLIKVPRRIEISNDEPLQSVHPGLATLLKGIGCEKAIDFAQRSRYDGIWSAGIFSPLSTVDGETWYGSHISRCAFDEYLLFCARRWPIQIIEDKITGFSQESSGVSISFQGRKDLECSYLIDASGRNRALGRMLNLKEEFFSPQITVWSGRVSGLENLFFEKYQTNFTPNLHGWTWLAPEPPEHCTWTRLSLTNQGNNIMPEELKNFGGGSGAIQTANMRWRMYHNLVINRVILTGDAAGNLDPGAGQGILNACYSGIMAGKALSYQNPAALEEYEHWFSDLFRQKVNRLKEYYLNLGIIF